MAGAPIYRPKYPPTPTRCSPYPARSPTPNLIASPTVSTTAVASAFLPAAYGLPSPIILQNAEETLIRTEDYALTTALLNSVTVSDKTLKVKLSADKKQIILGVRQPFDKVPPLAVLTLWSQKTPYSVVIKKSRKVNQTLTFDPKGKQYQKVQVAGSLNDWNPARTPLTYEAGVWRTTLPLEPGQYEYQIVVDGQWMLNPANPNSVDNHIGGFNSPLRVGGIDRKKLPRLYSEIQLLNSMTNQSMVTIGIENGADKIFAFWNGKYLPNIMMKERGRAVDIILPNEAMMEARSYIRVYAYNKAGVSNDLLIPFNSGQVVTDANLLTRNDKHTNIMYFMMVDRFLDGNPSNNMPVADPEVDARANYMGGDIAGIQQKLNEGYFNDLGINSLWISPIVQNPMGSYKEYPAPNRMYSGYHGYWPITLGTVNIRMGQPYEVQTMVQTAHTQNMNVILDFWPTTYMKNAGSTSKTRSGPLRSTCPMGEKTFACGTNTALPLGSIPLCPRSTTATNPMR